MKKIPLTLTFTTLITACSPVDSMQPFNHQQAANLIRQNHQGRSTNQKIALILPNKRTWQRVDLSYGTFGSPIMLIPMNEDRDNWTESFRTRIDSYANNPGVTPAAFSQEQINYAKNHCTTANGRIIQETRDYAIYDITMSGCQLEKNQTQIGKAIKGSDAVYLVNYSATSDINKTRFDKMAAVIKSAALVTR